MFGLIFYYTLAIPAMVWYHFMVDKFVYNTSGPSATQANFMGAFGAKEEKKNTIKSEEKSDEKKDSEESKETSEKEKVPDDQSIKKEYKWTVEIGFYITLHSLFSMFLPGYFYFILTTRVIHIFYEFCIIQAEYMTKIGNIYFEICLYFLHFMKVGNAVVDKLNWLLNKITFGKITIRKSPQSLITFSIAATSILSLGLFYLLKKWFVKKEYPKPNAGKDKNFQNVINLGLMVIAFVGWSDFGLWKQMQDWIRMVSLGNKIFGDQADDKTCVNYNPRKRDLNCLGDSKGPSPCLYCTSQKIASDPAILNRVQLTYSVESVMDNPSHYFYPLVKQLFYNNKKLPDWYLKLPNMLQESIYTSHYATIKNNIQKKFRLNHDRVVKGQYVFRRDEVVNKWTIVTPNYEKFMNDAQERLDNLDSSEPRIFTYDSQFDVSDDSDLDIEEKDAQLVPHTNNEQEFVAEAFTHEIKKEIDGDAIPFLEKLPPMFKPCIFLAGMCLLLFGFFYLRRKKCVEKITNDLRGEAKDQIAEKMNDDLIQKQTISTIAADLVKQSSKPIPPILKTSDAQLLEVEPEADKKTDHRGRRSGRTNVRHGHYRRREEEDDSNVVISGMAQSVFKKNNRKKQKKFICYDLADIQKLLAGSGLLMINFNDEAVTVKTMEEYQLYKQRGYQPDYDELFKISRATLDLSKCNETETLPMHIFNMVVSYVPLNDMQYRLMIDLIDEESVVPSPEFDYILSKYQYDFQKRKWYFSGTKGESNPSAILKREFDEVQQQQLELSTPVHVTPDEYEKFKVLVNKVVDISGNEELNAEILKMKQTILVAQPETNIATIKSDVCPAGSKCRTKNCVKTHADEPQSEALCGPVPIRNYPMNMDTRNAYPIFKKGFYGPHYATSYYTKLGFITNYHTFFYDRERNNPIPPNELEIEVNGIRHEILKYIRIPYIKGHDGTELPDVFQDAVSFVIKDVELMNSLIPAKIREPRDGEKIMVVSINQLNEEEYKKRKPSERTTIKTQEAVLRKGANGMFYFNTNNQEGDSGSGVYSLDQNFNVIGTYFGQGRIGVNTFIPYNAHHLPYVNSGQPFPQTIPKNFKPTI